MIGTTSAVGFSVEEYGKQKSTEWPYFLVFFTGLSVTMRPDGHLRIKLNYLLMN